MGQCDGKVRKCCIRNLPEDLHHESNALAIKKRLGDKVGGSRDRKEKIDR